MEKLLSLIDEIIAGCTNERSLTDLFRLCLVLADQLNVPALHTLADRELNGYSDPKVIPNFRLVKAGACGEFEKDGDRSVHDIRASAVDENDLWFATKIRLFESISFLEARRTTGIQYQWKNDLLHRYADRLPEGHLIRAWQFVTKDDLASVLDRIRTDILKTVVAIQRETESPKGEIVPACDKPTLPERANSIVINNFGPAYFTQGDLTQIAQQQNIEIDWELLRTSLERVGIPEAERNELHETLEKEKSMGEGVKGWISRNSGRVIDVGVDLGAKVLAEIITRSLGGK